MKKLVLVALALSSFAACKVEKTDEGQLPQVDVKGGDLPNYDVDPVDVDVETRQRAAEVKVPDIDVKTEKKQITVPDIDVDIGDGDDAVEPAPQPE